MSSPAPASPLKRIKVQDLRIGMFIHEFCGSWMDHPFWRNDFVVHDADDIARLRASSIQEVWIDCSKGLDVGVDMDEPAAAPDSLQPVAVAGRPAHIVRRAPAKEEIARAARICEQSRQAVISMFHEARMGKTVDTRASQQLVEDISASITRHPGALISLARLKTTDDYTYMHSVAVCALMVALARQLRLSEQETRAAGIAGLLHDLGKAAMPLEILNKPGKLTDAEFAVIKRHPAEGHAMLLGATETHPVALDVVLHHHEKINGQGYPAGLSGDAISLFARMGAVCDVYDAITSNRPYKAGWDPSESLRRMAEWQGHFDPALFQAFVKSLGIYPTGSLLRLSSGRLAIVLEQSERSLLKPIVKVFFSTRSDAHIPPEIIDLSHPACREHIAGREDPAKWSFPDLNALWSGMGDAGR